MNIDTFVSNLFTNLKSNFPVLIPIFERIAFIGSFQFIFFYSTVLICIFLLLFFFTRNKKYLYNYFIPFTSTILISTAITYFMKIYFARVGPAGRILYEIDYSFPSGHTTAATSFFGIIYFLFRDSFKNDMVGKWHKKILGFFCAISIALVTLSRLVLNVHYLSDVIVGFLIGIFTIYCILKLNDKKN